MEGRFWPKGYFPEGYWADGYFPDGVKGGEDNAGAGWLFFPELRRAFGFDPPLPVPDLQPAPISGVFAAQTGFLRPNARGVALNPPPPLFRPKMPELYLDAHKPVIGRGAATLSALSTIGGGRADLSRGTAHLPTVRPKAFGVGAVGVIGTARMDIGFVLRLNARMDHDVCSDDELLAMVAAAREQFNRTDTFITEDELLALVMTATEQFWGDDTHPGD